MHTHVSSGLDFAAPLPDVMMEYHHRTGALPEDCVYEPGYVCVWNNKHYIHTRATLPLLDIDHGVGFGFWVEVSAEEYARYLAAEQDEAAYVQFVTTGILANEWPCFAGTLGMEVTVRVVRATEKPYITRVVIPPHSDPFFEAVLYMSAQDSAQRASLFAMVEAWVYEQQ